MVHYVGGGLLDPGGHIRRGIGLRAVRAERLLVEDICPNRRRPDLCGGGAGVAHRAGVAAIPGPPWQVRPCHPNLQ